MSDKNILCVDLMQIDGKTQRRIGRLSTHHITPHISLECKIQERTVLFICIHGYDLLRLGAPILSPLAAAMILFEYVPLYVPSKNKYKIYKK